MLIRILGEVAEDKNCLSHASVVCLLLWVSSHDRKGKKVEGNKLRLILGTEVRCLKMTSLCHCM